MSSLPLPFPDIGAICRVMGVPPRGIAVWAGKPEKIGRRLFVYAAGGSGDLVAKVGLDDDTLLPKERDAILHLRELVRDVSIADALPEIVGYEHPVMVQRLLPGAALTESMLRGRRNSSAARAALFRAVRWLSAFHRATRTGSDGWTHGDFKPSNVLLDCQGGVAVIDWELAEIGWQEFDFWHLVTYAGLICAGGGNTWPAFRQVFIEPTWISRMIADALKLYAATGAVPQDAFERFHRYLDDVLRRRAALGLANTDYFLSDIRARLEAEAQASFLGV